MSCFTAGLRYFAAAALVSLSLMPHTARAITPQAGCAAGNDSFTFSNSHPDSNIFTGSVMANDTLYDPISGLRSWYGSSEGRTATGGWVMVSVQGGFEYFPSDHFVGTDSFTYSLYPTPDTSTGPCATATVTLSINTPDYVQINANDDSALTNDRTPVTLSPAANDLHVNTTKNGQLTVSNLTNLTPELGQFSQQGTSTYATVTFTPVVGQTGIARASYQINDAYGNTDTGVIAINVSPTNIAPVANNDSFSTLEDTVLTGNIVANDYDSNNDILRASLLYSPSHGWLTLNADGTFNYTPEANFNGIDSFAYTVTDGLLTSTATTTITVQPVNDSPVIADIFADTGKQRTILFSASAYDVDGSIVRYDWNFGDGSSTSSTLYQVSHGYKKNGTYTITLTVTDNLGATATKTMLIKIGK